MTIIKFRIVTIEIAFDKNSYFSENAQITVDAKYTTKPIMKKTDFPSIAHFFNIISPEASKIAAIDTRIKKINFEVVADIIKNICLIVLLNVS